VGITAVVKRGDGGKVAHPVRLYILVAVLVTATIGLLAGIGPNLWTPEWSWQLAVAALLLAVAVVLSDLAGIDLPISRLRIVISVSSALWFAAGITFGPLVGSLLATASALIEEIVDRRELIKLVVNMVNCALATFLAGWVYFALADTDLSPIGSLYNFSVTLVAALVFSVTQSLLLSAVLSQAGGTSPWYILTASARGLLVEFLALPALGALYPLLAHENPLALVLMIIPLLGPYFAFRNYRQLHHETQATFELLADLLDRRDPYTSEHSQRVAHLAEMILKQFPDLPYEEFEAILSAARIHDLGKIATTDFVLSKPGRLTDAEFAVITRPPVDASEIRRRLTPYRQIVRIVRHHHERWDGKGYPDGLAGEQIPFGSRVIAVADTYDAMTSDRAYRAAMTHEQAMAELRRCAGTQFDPAVVAAFERAVAAEVPERRLASPVPDAAPSEQRLPGL